MPKMDLDSWTTQELLELDGMEDELEEMEIDPDEVPEDELREVLLEICAQESAREVRKRGDLTDDEESVGDDDADDDECAEDDGADNGDLI